MPESKYSKRVTVGTKAGKKAAKKKLKALIEGRTLTRREQIDKALRDAGA